MDVHWEPAKATANKRKHGVHFADAEGVFYDPFALTIEDHRALVEERYVSVGRGASGQILVIVYTYRGDHIRLNSARHATRKELAIYEKRI